MRHIVLLAEFSGVDGFLGTRGSFMLDLVFLTMFAVLPVMAYSIYQVRFQRRYERHKRIQLAIGFILLVAVTAFEVDMRLNGWIDRAQPSRFWREGPWNDVVDWSLIVHLAFAIPTAFLWVFVIAQAIRKFPSPAAPNRYSSRHIFWARLAALGLTATSITGWIFYALAFAA